MVSYRYVIDIERIDTVYAVSAELHTLEPLLEASEISSLAVFNRAYVLITDSITVELVRGRFIEDKVVRDLVVIFASYYFEALNTYVATGTLPRYWGRAVSPIYSYALLQAASAHINHDLHDALLQLPISPRQLHRDYVYIGLLLWRTSPQAVRGYSEPVAFLNFLKIKLERAYEKLIMILILAWRQRAWLHYNYRHHRRSRHKLAREQSTASVS